MTSIFPVDLDAGLRHAVESFGIGHHGGGAIGGHGLNARGELVRVILEVFEFHFLTGVRGIAAHAGDEAGHDAAVHFVVVEVLGDGFHEVVPFQLVGIGFVLEFEGPHALRFLHLLALERLAAAGGVGGETDDGGAFAAVGVAVEILFAARHDAAVPVEFGSVLEGVFAGVGVEILIHIRAAFRVLAVISATNGVNFHRPGIFHPAALVDLVDVEIAEETTAGPEETVEPIDLVHHFRFAVGWVHHLVGL